MRPLFYVEPFRPAPGLHNPHLQTMAAQLLRGDDATDIVFRRERIFTPDDDFIDVDFADVAGVPWHSLSPKAPIVLALHGLEGSARRGYAQELYRQAAWRGIRPVGMNYRSCSGEMNWQPRVYNAGTTDDVDLVVQWLVNQFPGVPIGLVGFSLGGGKALKYLGESSAGGRPHIRAAVAISCAFNMMLGAKTLEEGLGPLYTRVFINRVLEKLAAKRPMYEDLLDIEQIQRARSFRELDDALTAPLAGYQDAADYYAKCSAGQFLPAISCPTLLLRAEDDPFFGRDIPLTTIAANPHLQADFPAQGGHLGFISRRQRRYQFWAERQAARFLTHQLNPLAIGQRRPEDVSL